MKQVKTVLVAITLIIGIGTPQVANAQKKASGSGSDVFAEAKRLTKGGDFIDAAYKVTVPIIGIMNLRDNSAQSKKGLMLKQLLRLYPLAKMETLSF